MASIFPEADQSICYNMTVDNPDQVSLIRGKVQTRRYRLSIHAEKERDSDTITIREIEETLISEKIEIIEDYPNDLRGRSCLILGFTENGKPLHIVCGLHEDILVIVTVYRPDPRQWINWRLRRKDR